MIQNWMYTWEEWRLFWSKVKGQILPLTTSFIGEISRTKFLVNMFFDRSSNDVVREKSKENSVLWPTKVAANKVVEFEIVRSVKGSEQSDCLPADIDMRSALGLSKAPFRTS